MTEKNEDNKPREMTAREVAVLLVEHIHDLCWYWGGLPGKSTRERLEGLAFSILSTLDGSGELPCFIIATDPPEEDKAFYIEQGSNWYPTQDPSVFEQLREPISPLREFTLHDLFQAVRREKR